ncbi:LBP / BPI / CETP family protein [Aphelenchoides besseyi]|nr:LBP / BPI / CETP family protein [Aphelenchoides besseyi]
MFPFRFLLQILLLFGGIGRLSADQRNPSVAVGLSKFGLQFFSSIGHKIMNHELPRIPFPNISFPINNGPGSGFVSVHGLKIPKFTSPLFRFQLSPEMQGMTWISDGGLIKLVGKWNAEYTFLTTFYLHGWVNVLARDVRSNVTLSVHGTNGHPQVDLLDGCAVDVLDVHLSLGGNVIVWIVNLFKLDLSYALKQMIHEQFCELMKTTLLKQANEALQTLPKHVNVAGDVFLDYELERQPVHVLNNSVLGRTYVDVMLNNEACSLKTLPLEIEDIDSTYMANIWIEQIVFDCLLLSAHKNNLFHFVLDRSIYAKLNTFLATDCPWFEICVGKFFKKLRVDYPERHIQMNFYSAEPPTVSFAENTSAHVVSKFSVDLQIQPETGKPNITSTLARIEMDMTATVNSHIFNSRVCGTVNSTQVRFNEVFSNIGEISSAFLDTLHLILTPVIEVAGDTVLRLGIPIPLVENISLSNRTQISFGTRAIRINTDLVYSNKTAITSGRRAFQYLPFIFI